MKKFLVGISLLISSLITLAQNKAIIVIKDSLNGELLPGVSIINKGAEPGHLTNTDGRSTIIISTPYLTISSTGYKTREIFLPLPLKDSVFTFLLEREEKELEHVIVSSSRTESRIEDLATRVEVLGAEEVEEESGLKPNNISSLLGDVAGIQTQQLSAATGNTELRIQGLPGKYTQILKDGVPLFGGYAGSFSILQIPPLDLKQVEIVKGASSTLYGGGAIAGMINLVSKKPKEGVFEKTVLLNASTLKETNLNVYLSDRNHKTGFTFFTGLNSQTQADVNNDGFSDVPEIKGIFFHPVFFIYPNEKNMLSVGYNGVYEKRNGGDMQVLRGKKDLQHQYFVFNETFRNSAEINWENKVNRRDRLNLKGTASWLNRSIETNKSGMDARQLSWFTELNYLKRFNKHDVVGGINFLGDDFRKKLPDSSHIPDHRYNTVGLFVQDDWRITTRFTMQSGLRIDWHNEFGEFVLPRISLMYKFNSFLTTRAGGGLGYKIPDDFINGIDERDLARYFPASFNIRDERSEGLNWDINYHQKIQGWDLTFNQTFFITNIKYPVTTYINPASTIYLLNHSQPVASHGFETYIQADHEEFEIYLGYTYTIAKKFYDPFQPYLDLSARNKFATVLAYEFTDNFRAGIEAALTGRQYLENGTQTPAFLFMAAMLRFDTGHFTFVLNCENLLDYRQSKKEIIVMPPYQNPTFKQLWSPIDGRIVNFSIRAKF